MGRFKEKSRGPVILGCCCLLALLAVTQLVAYQQYKLSKQKEEDAVHAELGNVKEKLYGILYNDITAANTLAIIYKEYGEPANYDSIAHQILIKSKYAEVIQLTKAGIITHVYPQYGYANTIGINTLGDSLRIKETKAALANSNNVYVAGPRALRQGGIGILVKVPIVANRELKGIVAVLTKLETIRKALGIDQADKQGFAYKLEKYGSLADTTNYLRTASQPAAGMRYVSVDIPEGSWKLSVCSADGVPMANIYLMSVFGLLMSITVAAYVYNRSSASVRLERMVDGKTHDLGERVKELTTIFVVNEILREDGQPLDVVFPKIIEEITKGWQYPDVCEARIQFDNVQYATKGYKDSPYRQVAIFILQDGRQGAIEVVYTEAKPQESEGPFLEEERRLINALADAIAVYLNKDVQRRVVAESEARFRGAFENAAIGMAIVSKEGKWMQVNKGLCNLVGYTQEELLSLSFQQLTHPEDVGKDIEFLKDALAGKCDYFHIEKRYCHKNGSIVWVNLNVALIRDEDGKPMYFVSLLENISGRIETQQKFQNLVEKSLVGVYIVQGYRFVYVNPWMIEQSGYSEEELLSSPLERFVHPDDLHIVMENIRARISGEKDQARYEARMQTKQGDIRWIEMLGTTILYGGAPAIIGTMVNITDKKNAYLELEKAVANLNTIFNNTAISFMLLDEQMRILSYNDYFGKGYPQQTGISLKEGAYYPDLMLPDKKEMLLRAIETVQATGRAAEYETVYDNKEDARYFNVVISPVLSNDTIIGYCIAGTDISTRKRMEMERTQIIYNLERRNKDLEQFSHILSHNVRAPLATLMGLTDIMQSVVDAEEQATISAGINESARHLDNMIKDLGQILDIKKDLSEARTLVYLQDVVADIEYMLSGIIKEKAADVQVDFAAVPAISTVRSFMYSILYNLVLNALKYTADGVTPLVKLRSYLQDDKVCIDVADNGRGMDLEQYGGQLFGIYSRFHADVDGQGLGLFMVKTQTESINGSIEVCSEVGKGTTFTISFGKKDVLG